MVRHSLHTLAHNLNRITQNAYQLFLGKFVVVYIDDILVYNKSLEELVDLFVETF